MENPSYVMLSRQATLRRQMDITANNIANGTTPAFKADRIVFAEHLARVGRDRPLSYVRDIGVARDMSEGPMRSTGNPLDLAIHGDGFFAVETPEGIRYTRTGRFEIDEAGQLVTAQGHPVLDAGDAPILLGPEDAALTVSADGILSSEAGEIAELRRVRFAEAERLVKLGDGLYAADAPPLEIDDAPPRVLQGMVEESNVEPVVELTRMMALVRAYQAAQQMIEAEDERQRQAIDAMPRIA